MEENTNISEIAEIKQTDDTLSGALEQKTVKEKKPHKRIITGVVVSDKPHKTIIVKYERQVSHPIYKKYYKKSKKLMAHDENNDAHTGDIVRIRECRPLSARKRWELIEIVQRAK